MDKIKNDGLFKDKEEAKKALQYSRKRIDEIDEKWIELISERTSLAKDIAIAKIFLGMNIYDENREKTIYKKILKLAIDKNIDESSLIEIMNIITNLSKNQQKEILRRIKDGEY